MDSSPSKDRSHPFDGQEQKRTNLMLIKKWWAWLGIAALIGFVTIVLAVVGTGPENQLPPIQRGFQKLAGTVTIALVLAFVVEGYFWLKEHLAKDWKDLQDKKTAPDESHKGKPD
jgi:hypothetical protein